MKLSKEQQEVVNAIDGQILVIACPGSGKTTVLVERAVNMVKKGIAPESMLNITFTKAAANEMEKRFKEKCDDENVHMKFSTIHAFCYRLLCSKYGYKSEDIFKESEKWAFIRNMLSKIASGSRLDEYTSEVMQGISYIKNRELTAEKFKPEKVKEQTFQSVYSSYESYRKSKGKIDFDDMIIIFRDKLKTDANFLEYCRNIYKYVTVDEFQDVNRIQAQIVMNIAGPSGNIFVVGDDDQSIYRFRGASPGIMMAFPIQYKNCQKFELSTNYRSKKGIINMASKLIEHNTKRFPKNFLANTDDAGDIYLLKSQTTMIQAKQIVKEAHRLRKEGVPYEKMAILYRNNDVSLPIVNYLIRVGMPFSITDGTSSIHNDSIYKDIVAYWNLANGSERQGDLLRVLNHPSRYLPVAPFKNAIFNSQSLMNAADKTGKDYARARVQDLLWDVNMFSRQKSPRKFLDYLVNSMNYQKWLKENAEYLGIDAGDGIMVLDALRMESRGFETMQEWFDYVSEYEVKLYQASHRKEKEGITLSTFHSAKGLEYDVVFVVSANEDITPHVKARTKADIEEERRAFYVAVTRAKNTLYLSYVTGAQKEYSPSRFLKEMGFKKKN